MKFGAPGEIRTPDNLVRSQGLYPAELRARNGILLENHQLGHLGPGYGDAVGVDKAVGYQEVRG